MIERIPVLKNAGHQLALLSNIPGQAIRAIMKHFGLDGFFTSIITGGDVKNLKPEPYQEANADFASFSELVRFFI